MAKTTDTPKARTRPESPRSRGRRIARTLAHGSLLAAGIAFTQLSGPEIDPRYSLFNPKLMDRLQEPISRYHE